MEDRGGPARRPDAGGRCASGPEVLPHLLQRNPLLLPVLNARLDHVDEACVDEAFVHDAKEREQVFA